VVVLVLREDIDEGRCDAPPAASDGTAEERCAGLPGGAFRMGDAVSGAGEPNNGSNIINRGLLTRRWGWYGRCAAVAAAGASAGVGAIAAASVGEGAVGPLGCDRDSDRDTAGAVVSLPACSVGRNMLALCTQCDPGGAVGLPPRKPGVETSGDAVDGCSGSGLLRASNADMADTAAESTLGRGCARWRLNRGTTALRRPGCRVATPKP